MPKQKQGKIKHKTRGAVKKRFKVTKTGKVMSSKPGRGHMHATYNGETGRNLRRKLILNKTWSDLVRPMLEG
ncbi:MAG: 50S ribosomal protein L35 [Planctomycetia bacterium]|jgi:ribosomal protein L35